MSRLRASTSDLLPTFATLVGAALPDRPLDGIDLMPLLTAGATERPSPLYFWGYDVPALRKRQPEPYFDPALQAGTTPLVKLSQGLPTRNFENFRLPEITEADYGGTRAIIDGSYKLLIQQLKNGETKTELYNLESDRGEEKDLAAEQPERVAAFSAKLREWQSGVLHSLLGEDYQK